MEKRDAPAACGLYIETADPGAVVVTNSPKFLEGARAVLGRRDVGLLLNVLCGMPGAEARCSGGFRLVHNHVDSGDPDYVATFDDGSTAKFGAPDARDRKSVV